MTLLIRVLHVCHSLTLLIVFSICLFGLYSECEAGNGYIKFSEAASKLAQKGEYEKAVEVLNFGIQKYRHAGPLYYQRAVCLYKIHNYKFLLKDFNTAISLSPRYDKAYFSRAKVYAKIVMIEKARLDLKKYRAVNLKMAKATHVLMKKILLGSGEF